MEILRFPRVICADFADGWVWMRQKSLCPCLRRRNNTRVKGQKGRQAALRLAEIMAAFVALS